VAYFFLGCVIVAGLYGAYSADKKIFFVQGMPAIIALAVVILSKCCL
jgi:putative membrane protein